MRVSQYVFRYFRVLLLLSLAFVLLLSSCQEDTTVPGGGTVLNESMPIEGEYLKEPIVLSDSDGVYYTLVHPQKAPSFVSDCVAYLRGFPADNGAEGLSLSYRSDAVSPGTNPSEQKEILIGNTGRAETKAVMAELSYGDYAVVAKGQKIVVAAHTKETMKAAVEVLYQELLKIEVDETGRSRLIFTQNYYAKSDRSPFFTEENPLSRYQIVCNTETRVAASKLQQAIQRTFRIPMTVVDESEAETELEIVVGDVARDIAGEIANHKLDDLEYHWITKEKKFFITAVSNQQIDRAVEAFCEKYINTAYSSTFNLFGDLQMKELVYVFEDDAAMAQGSDVRVMSFNVLCELWDDLAKNYQERARTAAAAIRYYAPDVVGLQEISDAYHAEFQILFGDDYQLVDAENEKNQTNFSPLAYNTKKVTLQDHGTQIFAIGNSTQLRLASWGVFETKDSGKRFLVVNTHWDLTKNPAYRTEQSTEMAHLIRSLQKRFQCPVIATGDYNTYEHEEQYKSFVAQAALIEAKYTARTIKRSGTTYHDLGVAVDTVATESIDHIFATRDASFLYYNTLIDPCLLNASDHCPIYADVCLDGAFAETDRISADIRGR